VGGLLVRANCPLHPSSLGLIPYPIPSDSQIYLAKGVPLSTNSNNKIVTPPPRRDWHVVADDLKEEHDPVRRTQLLQELADRIWFDGTKM
jgi:hypothetical protein